MINHYRTKEVEKAKSREDGEVLREDRPKGVLGPPAVTLGSRPPLATPVHFHRAGADMRVRGSGKAPSMPSI